MMWLLPRLQPFSMQPYCHLLRLGGTARLSAPCCAFRAISFTLVSHVLFIGGSSAISARCNCANASSGLFKELIKRRGGKGFMGFFFLPLLLDPQLPVTAGHSTVFAFDTVACRADISHGGTNPSYRTHALPRLLPQLPLTVALKRSFRGVSALLT